MCKNMLCISSPIASWCDRMQLLILGQLITRRTQFAKQVFHRFRMPLLARDTSLLAKISSHECRTTRYYF